MALSLGVGNLFAQATATATLQGTVLDKSGAVIPNVKVTVSNPERGFVRDVASNAAGEYTAARIPSPIETPLPTAS